MSTIRKDCYILPLIRWRMTSEARKRFHWVSIKSQQRVENHEMWKCSLFYCNDTGVLLRWTSSGKLEVRGCAVWPFQKWRICQTLTKIICQLDSWRCRKYAIFPSEQMNSIKFWTKWPYLAEIKKTRIKYK